MQLGRPQRVAAEVEPEQSVADRDLVLDLGLLDALTTDVARITVADAAPGPPRLFPGQVVRYEFVENPIGETLILVHGRGPPDCRKEQRAHITGVLTPGAPT
jgi:hypothetical protein